MSKSNPRIHIRRDEAFVSNQAPRHWKHHKGKFDSKGRPIFNNMREAHEAARRARGEEGSNVHYDEL